jgi:hypothetical protein
MLGQMGSDDLNREADPPRRRAEPLDADERFERHGIGNATTWERQIRRSSTDTLSETKRGRSSHHSGILLTGYFGQNLRFGMVGSGRTLATRNGTDWALLDELKRKLKDVR